MNTDETRTKGRTAFSGSVKSVLIRGLLRFRLFGARSDFIRSTTKDTKVHEGNLWIYLIEIFVLFVSFVVNIESSWNLRGLATGPHTGRIRPAANQWATLKMTIERQATD